MHQGEPRALRKIRNFNRITTIKGDAETAEEKPTRLALWIWVALFAFASTANAIDFQFHLGLRKLATGDPAYRANPDAPAFVRNDKPINGMEEALDILIQPLGWLPISLGMGSSACIYLMRPEPDAAAPLLMSAGVGPEIVFWLPMPGIEPFARLSMSDGIYRFKSRSGKDGDEPNPKFDETYSATYKHASIGARLSLTKRVGLLLDADYGIDTIQLQSSSPEKTDAEESGGAALKYEVKSTAIRLGADYEL